MSDGVVVADGQASQPGLSQMERVVDTFVAPSKTFTDILRNRSWWLPFLLIVLVSWGVTFAVTTQVGWQQVVENQIHSSPKQEDGLASLTPEQRAARVHGMAIGYKYTSYGFPVLVLIFSAIAALGLWATFNFGLGASTTFGEMFCIWMYCSLPKLIIGLLTILMLFVGGNAEAYDMKNPVGTNLGYYFADAGAGIKSALGFFDVFGIWSLILLILATSIVAKVSRGKAAAAIIGWWVLILIVSTAAAAAFN